MKKRILMFILAVSMVLSLALGAAAEETKPEREPGQCGESLTWAFEDGTLTVTGEGAMDDYEDGGEPWHEHKNEVTTLVLKGGVTYIGAYAFKDYDGLKTVDFGDALYEIGPFAFSSCDGLTAVTMPASFKIFGERSFQSCKNLTVFHCEGKFPSFKESCLWAVYATIYYPAATPWSVTYIEQLEAAFKGRIEFLDSDGVDHFTPTEATEETVEETTEATTEPTVETAVETEEVTEAPTEMTTEATTEPTTIPTEESQAETIEELLPVQDEDQKGWIGLVIVAGVLAILCLGGLAFGKKNRRSGKFSRR